MSQLLFQCTQDQAPHPKTDMPIGSPASHESPDLPRMGRRGGCEPWRDIPSSGPNYKQFTELFTESGWPIIQDNEWFWPGLLNACSWGCSSCQLCTPRLPVVPTVAASRARTVPPGQWEGKWVGRMHGCSFFCGLSCKSPCWTQPGLNVCSAGKESWGPEPLPGGGSLCVSPTQPRAGASTGVTLGFTSSWCPSSEGDRAQPHASHRSLPVSSGCPMPQTVTDRRPALAV